MPMPWVDASRSHDAIARLRSSAGLTVQTTTATATTKTIGNATFSSMNTLILRRRLQASSTSAADAAVASSSAVESGIAFGANNFYGSTTGTNSTNLSNATNDSFTNANGQFNPVVFWGVNAFIAFLLIAACTWCWWCGGWKWSATASSDVEYRRRLAEQQQQRQLTTAAWSDDLETRQRKIVASFDKCHVKQVVAGQDFVGPESSSNCYNTNERGGGNRLDRRLVEKTHDDPDHTAVDTVTKMLWNGKFGMSFSDLKEEEDDRKKEDTDLEAVATASTREGQIEENATAPLSFSSSINMSTKQEALENKNEGGEDNDVDDECDAGHIRIQGGQRLVPNCCAICLSHYEIGETIVWSSNTDCRHAFHEECITDWLVKLHVQQPSPPNPPGTTTTPVVVVTTPCPCCRQEFTILEEEEEEENSRVEQKIPWRPGLMFHPRNSSSSQ